MLKAALYEGDLAAQAWRSWETEFGGLRHVLQHPTSAAVKRLLPLLSASQVKNRIQLPPDLQTILRTALLREQSRYPVFRQATQSALGALRHGDIRFLVLKGAANAETDYAEPALRHCHDCDLFIERRDLDRARQSLLSAGFREICGADIDKGDSISLAHPNGLPINLHSRLLRFPEYDLNGAGLWNRARKRSICGVEALALSPEDALLHVCVHSTTTYSRQFLCWVCDSWMLMAKNRSLDWDQLCRTAREGRLGLPTIVIFEYLAGELRAPIPETAIDGLRVQASRTPLPSREAALFGLVAGQELMIRRIVQGIRSLSDALTLAKWALLPSPAHLRWKYRITQPWLLPVYYLLRPLRAVAYRVRRSRSRRPLGGKDEPS